MDTTSQNLSRCAGNSVRWAMEMIPMEKVVEGMPKCKDCGCLLERMGEFLYCEECDVYSTLSCAKCKF